MRTHQVPETHERGTPLELEPTRVAHVYIQYPVRHDHNGKSVTSLFEVYVALIFQIVQDAGTHSFLQ